MPHQVTTLTNCAFFFLRRRILLHSLRVICKSRAKFTHSETLRRGELLQIAVEMWVEVEDHLEVTLRKCQQAFVFKVKADNLLAWNSLDEAPGHCNNSPNTRSQRKPFFPSSLKTKQEGIHSYMMKAYIFRVAVRKIVPYKQVQPLLVSDGKTVLIDAANRWICPMGGFRVIDKK